MKKIISVLLCIIIFSGIIPLNIFAEESSSYSPDDAFALYFYGNKSSGKHMGYYGSPYSPIMQYDEVGETPYNDFLGVNALYNKATGEMIPVYCIDQYTGVVPGTSYKRVNVEDSTFFSDSTAAVIRSIVLNGFPAVSAEELSSASGIENLTVGEAVTATQLALWQTAYGDAFEIHNYAGSVTNFWTKNIYRSYILNYDLYYQEYSGYAQEVPIEKIAERIEKCTKYLLALAPTAPSEKAVSSSSFISWNDDNLLKDNGDGTFDISVNVTLNVTENAGDNIKLSAVAGSKFVTVELADGYQTVDIVIKNVPEKDAFDKIKLAIDGTQTVSDVFFYTAPGGRETAQQFVGYNTFSLPVHEEIFLEPERVIKFHKTDKIEIGTDESGNKIYDYVDLEGIVFDLYFVADWTDYVNGKITLPDQEDIDLDSLGGDQYHYPHYTVVTDENGYASVNLTKEGLPDGVYVLAERNHSAIVEPVAPFYIIIPYTNEDGDEWLYELTISPKNDVKGDVRIEKDVIKIGNNLATVDAYKDHVWIVGTSIPADISDGKEYIITDTIDNRLSYIGNMVIRVEYTGALPEGTEPITPVALEEGTDYTLEVVDTDQLSDGKPNDSFTVSLTRTGMKKIGLAVGTNSSNYILRTYFDLQINANAVMGELIPNKAFLDYTNSVNYKFRVESDIPEVYTCGIRLLKVDANNESVTLTGAEFAVYRIVTAEELSDETIEKVNINGVSAVVTPVEFFDNDKLVGDKVTKATSNENGDVIIYGLAEGEYYIVETKAPAGYNLLGAAVKLELNKISHIGENAVKIKNTGGTILPETGGIGTGIYLISGSLLLLTPIVYLIVKRSKVNRKSAVR